MNDAAISPLTPVVTAAGIGVTDLAKSSEFYQEVFELQFRYQLDTPYWKEDILEDPRGNSVVIMRFARERNTQKNPVKLVFAVTSAATYLQKVIDAGGTMVSPVQEFAGAKIALAYDIDSYLVELIEVATVPRPVLVGVGIGVRRLDEAADFYTRVLGMRFVRDIDLPGFMDEKELASPAMRGPAIVLMHYEDQTRVYKDIPAKVVLGVGDAAGYAARIMREDPSKVLSAPGPYGDSGIFVGMARDLDGYLVEILQTSR